MKKMNIIFSLITMCLLVCSWTSPSQAQTVPPDLLGDWTLDLDSAEPAWMSIVETEAGPVVYWRVYLGSDGPYKVSEVIDDRIKFTRKRKRKSKKKDAVRSDAVSPDAVRPDAVSPDAVRPDAVKQQTIEFELNNGTLEGVIIEQSGDSRETRRVKFTGKRIPPMPDAAPDLSKVRFGRPVSLFNGKDLTGWRPHEADKINGWTVEKGMLVNKTAKTDFSPTGDHANLRTVAEFEDFWLHIEFLVEQKRNSGIYLRGMYEAQVVDRDSRMQGLQGVGAIFGRIAPTTNAGNPGGQWQTYDITLVDRHVTVVLNGVKVIDNQPVIGPTSGAIYTDPAAPGPIYLQGDHTMVKYKNIYLAPVLK